MNRSDIAHMLGEISAIDPTVPRPSGHVLDGWAQMLDDVPLAAGQEAVRAYYQSDAYAEHKRTITPADIYHHHRAAHRDQVERNHSRELANRRAALDAAPQPVRSLAERFAVELATRRGDNPETAEAEAAARRGVLAVECPHPRCRAPRGVHCTSYSGRRLRRALAHPSRVEAATGQAMTNQG